jgi:riboflavin synthase
VVQASAETLKATTLAAWRPGTRVNLERPLKVGDELGGHIVSGHVDGLAEIVAIEPEGDSRRFRFRVPAEIARFMAPKGSVALDGISLTVNEVEASLRRQRHSSHARRHHLGQDAEPGQVVNVEVDMLARYVARLREFSPT